MSINSILGPRERQIESGMYRYLPLCCLLADEYIITVSSLLCHIVSLGICSRETLHVYNRNGQS